MLHNYNRTEKPVNESFFDKKSEKMYYIIGASYSCYYPFKSYKGRPSFIFKSRHEKLVEMVRDEIFPNHAVVSDNRKGKSSNWIEVASTPKLHSRLEELGLNVSKDKREFPEDIPECYLSHFIRGFLDAKAGIRIEKRHKFIDIFFNKQFLSELHEKLVKSVGVKRSLPKRDRIIYHTSDSMKIRDFIYQDFGFIKEHGLYLPEKKKLLDSFIIKESEYKILRRNKMINKIEEAKMLFKKGLESEKVAEKLGYVHLAHFYTTFKRVTGYTPAEYKEKFKEGFIE